MPTTQQGKHMEKNPTPPHLPWESLPSEGGGPKSNTSRYRVTNFYLSYKAMV